MQELWAVCQLPDAAGVISQEGRLANHRVVESRDAVIASYI
jgi:hypothetical protein